MPRATIDPSLSVGVGEEPFVSPAFPLFNMSSYSIKLFRTAGFTLIELLVVIALIVGMAALAIPAFNAIKSGKDLAGSAAEIKGLLDQARTYAMANNTYVYVGVTEVDAMVAPSAKPQTPADASHGGRVAVGIVASRDGTKNYATATANQGADWQSSYGTGGKLFQLGKTQHFENVHLAVLNGPAVQLPQQGGMNRPRIGDAKYVLAGLSATDNTQIPFTLPLGSQLTGGYQYRFDKVIQFDPQGVARLVFVDNGDEIPAYVEIGLVPAHGNAFTEAPTDQSTGQIAAVQLDCMNGKVRLYKP